MKVIDYNGQGDWSADAIVARYRSIAGQLGIEPRDVSPSMSEDDSTRWVYPVMSKIIEGIEAGDRACIEIGIEFIEQDQRFTFGRTLKSAAARALRRQVHQFTDAQKKRIRERVFAMFEAGNVPHEFVEYSKLVRAVGFESRDVPFVRAKSARMKRFIAYFAGWAGTSSWKPNAGD